jgi:predicted DsbA family dithiol-disulfide isomerase
MVITIDVVSDVVCPWCYVGKAQLDKALQQFASTYPDQPAPQVRYLPFQLNPQLPEQGIERTEYLKGKFGNADLTAIYSRVEQAASAVDLTLALAKINRQPNTLKAHALLLVTTKAPALKKTHETLANRFFKAYFEEGADLTNDTTLESLAIECGLTVQLVQLAWSKEFLQLTANEDLKAREAGISGVPFFIVNQTIPLSGAVGSGALFSALETVQNTPKSPAA